MKKIQIIVSLVLAAIISAEPIPLQIDAPLDHQVVQRSDAHLTDLAIRGRLTVPAEVVEVRLNQGPWQEFPTVDELSFNVTLKAPAGGWHELTARVRRDEEILAQGRVEHVGVGEVFVIAGQSNSANHGEEKQKIRSGLVSTFDGQTWRIAHDPQPGASGGGGSFLPAFAEALVTELKVPVGIVATGVGATSVREWLPKGSRFPHPPTIMSQVTEFPDGGWMSKGEIFTHFVQRAKSLGPMGFRAVLWHQGESDANQRDPTRTLPGTLYREYLTRLIKDSRQEVGWEFPWFVAQASYHTPDDPGSPDIRAAQKALWDSGIALEGPDSDALTGRNREDDGKGVHFSATGLKAHGEAWAEKVIPFVQNIYSSD